VIQLTGANCKNGLEVDDAFAGGVCRCQYCGTIQTVPKPGARPRAPGSPLQQSAGAPEEPKALYQVKSRTGLSSAPSGLEELAEVVHSSGLSSGLAHRTSRNMTTASPAQQKAANKATLIAFVVGFVVIAILSAGAMYLVFGSKDGGTTDTGSDGGVATNIPSTPSFLQAELNADKVVYVIDRGDATANFFPVIKNLTTRSVRSLGGDRKFAVVLWNNGSDDAFPRSGSTYASSEEAEKLKTWFDDVSTGRATTVESAIQHAVEQSPGEIVLVTAKSDQLEGSDFVNNVLNAVKGKSIKILTVTLGDSPAGDPLKKIALETKGKFIHLTRQRLAEFNE